MQATPEDHSGPRQLHRSFGRPALQYLWPEFFRNCVANAKQSRVVVSFDRS
jgi:hypothetical protein